MHSLPHDPRQYCSSFQWQQFPVGFSGHVLYALWTKLLAKGSILLLSHLYHLQVIPLKEINCRCVCFPSPLSLHFSERSINGIKILSLHIRLSKRGQSAHVKGQVCMHTLTSTCIGIALHFWNVPLYTCAYNRRWERPWNLLSAPLKARL